MGGVISEFDSEFTVVYHWVEDRELLAKELTVVVAWRRGRAPRAGWRARVSRWQFRWGLHPLNRRISIGRDAGLWYGSSAMNGEQVTMFHPTRRVVRALNREYTFAPPGMTLVLLIDESVPSPSVREMQIPAARVPRPAEQVNPESGHSRRAAHTEETEAWRTALRTHHDIAAFFSREAL